MPPHKMFHVCTLFCFLLGLAGCSRQHDNAGAKEYTDSRLSKGQIVSYRVRALNDAGESAYSNIVRIRM